MKFKKFQEKFKGEDLKKLQNLNDKEGYHILKKMPKKLVAGLYADFCTEEQLKQLLEEYEKYILDPGAYPGHTEERAIKKRYSKKMLLLLKALKKKKKPIPKEYLKYLK